MNDRTPWERAVFQLEAIHEDLPRIAKIPGLRFVERNGTRIFSCVGLAAGEHVAFAIMVVGDDNRVNAFDFRSDGEPFHSNGVDGIALRFEKANSIDDISQIIYAGIKKLRFHLFPCAPGNDWALDSCWRH